MIMVNVIKVVYLSVYYCVEYSIGNGQCTV